MAQAVQADPSPRTGPSAAGDGRWWAFCWGAATLVLATLPYLVVWLRTPDGFSFSGLLVHPADGFSYLAKMRQGYDGAWLFTIPYGTETHQPAPIYAFYLLLGHLARWSGLPPITVYHVARLATGVTLLMAFWDLLAIVCIDARSRRLGFALGCLGAGLGWLALPFGVLAPDLTVPEGSVFYSAFANPHFPAALAGYAGAVSCFWRAVSLKSGGWTIAATVCAVGMAIIHPHLVPPLAVLLVATVLLTSKADGLAAGTVRAGIVLTAAVIPAALQTWALATDPVLSVWSAQNRTPSPPLPHLVIGLGAPGLLAAVGAAVLFRGELGGNRHSGPLVGTVWLAVTLALLFAPLDFQRRYYEGIQFPIAAFAGMGGAALFGRGRVPRVFAALLFMLAVPTTLLNAALPVLGTAGLSTPVHIAETDLAAYAWLDENATAADVVLAGPNHGNQVPAYAGVRVFWGHPFETVNSAAKLNAVRDFYAGRTSDASEGFVNGHGVTLVYVGEEERAMMPPANASHIRGEEVFRAGEVSVLRIGPQTR